MLFYRLETILVHEGSHLSSEKIIKKCFIDVIGLYRSEWFGPLWQNNKVSVSIGTGDTDYHTGIVQ